jgi:hypothetical protein
MEEQAILKFNDGAGALLCSGCNRIISTGSSFTEKEWMAMQGKLDLPPQYCKDCREVSKNGNNETVTSGHELTAVGWLIKQLEELLYWETFDRIEDKLNEAKAMERQQIADAMMYALDEDGHSLQWRTKFVEKYYTETYNK